MRALRLDDVAMEVRSRELLTQLSAKIPSVGVPVAALSGGQRQTVAIARSLLGDPKVIILDEPTAALGVAQTAEVLNLIERLRERGHGVIMISHNMADVTAVADTVAVLRLGRNNGVFDARTTSAEELVAAITGATDNVVSRRAVKATTATATATATATDDNATPKKPQPRRRNDARRGRGTPRRRGARRRRGAGRRCGARRRHTARRGRDVPRRCGAWRRRGARRGRGVPRRCGAWGRRGARRGHDAWRRRGVARRCGAWGGAGVREAAGESAGIGDDGAGERVVRGWVRKGAGDE